MTEVRRGNGVALWRQIADSLRQDIRGDVIQRGERLPTETDLAARFGVNRHTIRQAVASLADEGLVSVEQGRGTFVPERLLDYPVGKRTRFSANMQRVDSAPGHELLTAELVAADRDAAAGLGLRPGGSVVFARVLSTVNGRPVAIGHHYFAARRFPGMVETFRETASVTEVLSRHGVPDYTRKETRITARAATAEECRLLRLPGGRSLLVSEAVNVDPEGRRLEYGVTLFAADRVQLVFET